MEDDKKTGPVVTVYVDRPQWNHWQDLLKEKEGKTVSARIRELVKIDMERLEGIKENSPKNKDLDYAAAMKNFQKLVKEIETLRKNLKKANVFDTLMAMAEEAGLDTNTCKNVDEVAPKVLERWISNSDNQPELGLLFVILMQKNKEERELEALLTTLLKKEGRLPLRR